MIRSLWIAKSGMEGQQFKLDTISNNLANVATNGYKRGGVVFEDLIYENLRRAGAASSDQTQLPTGLQVGLGVRVRRHVANFSQGNLQQTENNLDLAIKGQGFFPIQLPDGSTGYTRDGSLQLDRRGQHRHRQRLMRAAGHHHPGQCAERDHRRRRHRQRDAARRRRTPQSVGQLQLASFINPGGLEPRGQNLYAETAASGTPSSGAPGSDGRGALLQGFVEGSNVNVVEELVSMIATQRAYELNSKAIQTTDQMLQRLGQL